MAEALENLVMVVSRRADGSMREPAPQKQFVEHLGLERESVVLVDAVHGTQVQEVGRHDGGTTIPHMDGLITQETGIFVGVLPADCFPVFFYEKTTGTAAVAHAGWRGVVAGIVTKTVQRLREIGVSQESLYMTIGPGLRVDHMEIGEDVLPHFWDYEYALEQRRDKIFVDLPKIITNQAQGAGLHLANINDFQECTYCLKQKYFSYRRDNTEERMLALIGWKGE